MDDTPGPPASVRALIDRLMAAMSTLRRAEADVLHLVDAMDDVGAAADTGYGSTERLLADVLRVDRRDARSLLAQGAVVSERTGLSGSPVEPALPATAQVLDRGELGRAHVDVIAATMQRLARVPHVPAGVVDEVERQLAELARSRSPRQLARAAAEILLRVDPDGELDDEPGRPDQELHLSTGRDGSLRGRFRFADPEAAATLRTAIDALTPPPDADPDAGTLGRGPAERRADALRDMAADSLGQPADDVPDGDLSADGIRLPADEDAHPMSGAPGADPYGVDPYADWLPPDPFLPEPLPDDAEDHSCDAFPAAFPEPFPDTFPAAWLDLPANPGHSPPARARPRPRTQGGDAIGLIVTVPLEVLEQRARERAGHGLLDGDRPVSPETARRLACDAMVVPAVLGSRGEVLDLGRRTRVVSTPQRRALIARDRHCAHPGCRRPPRHCRAHHIVPWSWGGSTDLDNLVLLCAYHHHLVHHSGWSIHMHRGRPVFTPPAWLDPRRRPRTDDATVDA